MWHKATRGRCRNPQLLLWRKAKKRRNRILALEIGMFVAARLTVVISQSSIRHSQATDAEEQLLGELMMTAGLDATLIGSLDNVQIDSTDYLCLSGFASQRLALVSALSLEEVAEQWRRLQLGGQVVRVGEAGSATGRRIYYFALSSNVESTLAELRQLLSDQSVKTVDVLMPLGKTAQPAASSHDSGSMPSGSQTPLPVHQPPLKKLSNRPASEPALPAASIPVHSTAQGDSGDESEEQWPDLDRLVDDFDALDL